MSQKIVRKPDRGERHVTRQSTIQENILEKHKKLMKRKDEPSKAFLIQQDIDSIWSDDQTLWEVLGPKQWSSQDLVVIRKSFLKILSTLILIGASSCIQNFRTNFFHPETGFPYQTDDDLPFMETDLRFLELAHCILFVEKQYCLLPEVITESVVPENKEIHHLYRLPFEYVKRNVGGGAYGTVDEVGISPGYLKDALGKTWPEVKAVACKRIQVDEEFSKEVKNLQILRESLTSHQNIMLHLATIVHGTDHLILLPFAKHHDLEIFLHRGIDHLGREIYDFDRRFPRLNPENPEVLRTALFVQAYLLADGLRWLHNDLKVGEKSNMFCAHMDLKPNNVLVEHDKESPIGRWMLADFGISVFDEDTQRQDSNIVSIRDYYSQATMNTRPKRNRGTYQAPEVQSQDAEAEDASNSQAAKQRRVGRKSDVWSFGCIYSEVLVFAIGQSTLVKSFQKIRKNQTGDDLFYREKDLEYLTAQRGVPEYEVRPWITKWLSDVPEQYTHPGEWLNCCVETILRILSVDIEQRPNSEKLVEMTRHVITHLRDSKSNGVWKCPTRKLGITSKKDELSFAASPSSEPQHASNNMGRESSWSPSDPNAPLGPLVLRSDTSGPEILSGEKSTDSTFSESLITIPDSLNIEGDSVLGDLVLLQSQRPSGSHGILSNPTIPRKVLPSTSLTLKTVAMKRGKLVEALLSTVGNVIDVAVSSDGRLAAYLIGNLIHLFDLKLESTSFTEREPLSLESETGWKRIVVAGSYLAAWGHSSFQNKKLIYLCHLENTQLKIDTPVHEQVASLESIALSKYGAVAFVCGERVLFSTIDSRVHGRAKYDVPLEAQKKRTFTHAAFNETGELLYAWAYGRHSDHLYVWRIKDGTIARRTDTEDPYQSKQHGDPKAVVLPYSSFQGSIIEASGKTFFPAQIQSSQRGGSNVLPRHEIVIPDALLSCVFQNHSLLTIEKKSMSLRHPRLKEYVICHGGSTTLEEPGNEICSLEKGSKSTSKMTVAKFQENLFVVVCNIGGTIEIIKIVPRR